MSKLIKQLSKKLCPGMTIPDEFQLLYKWIERKRYYRDRPEFRLGWLADENSPGTLQCFKAEGNDGFSVETWPKEFFERFSIFGGTGGDGSVAAFWLNDLGEQKIVHFGSGSGSTLLSILVNSPLDYLRLLAIGYEEVCWSEYYESPPSLEDIWEDYDEETILDAEYRAWVINTFGVDIPSTASEVVVSTSLMSDEHSNDDFWNWIHRIQQH